MLVTSLVLPGDLANQTGKISLRGQLRGAFLKEESLFVAYEGLPQEGDEEGRAELETKPQPVRTAACQRVFKHLVFANNTTKEETLPYVVFKSGLKKALTGELIKSRNDLTQWTVDGRPVEAAETEAGILCVCALELTDEEDATSHVLICVAQEAVYHRTAQTISAEPKMPTRMDGLAPVQALGDKRVAVIGLGSGGSMAALNLAAAGVGTLHLFDHDRLSVDNVFRHACDIRHVGRAKVLAMRDLIADQQLSTKVVPHDINVVGAAASMWPLVEEFDLVVCATDNPPSRNFANYLCIHTATPLLLGCAFHNARIGEIVRVLPGRSACLECTRRHFRATGALSPLTSEDHATGNVPYRSQEETTQVPPAAAVETNTGTRTDVAIVAALLSRAAIVTLLQNISGIREPDLPTDYFTWGVSSLTDFPDPFAFALPFSVNWLPIPRQKDCPICSNLGEPYDPATQKAFTDIMESVPRQDEANASPGAGIVPSSPIAS